MRQYDATVRVPLDEFWVFAKEHGISEDPARGLRKGDVVRNGDVYFVEYPITLVLSGDGTLSFRERLVENDNANTN
jgi:hypothetical protein